MVNKKNEDKRKTNFLWETAVKGEKDDNTAFGSDYFYRKSEKSF